MSTGTNTLNPAAHTTPPKTLTFSYFPAFAQFILDHHIPEFTATQLRYSVELDLPLLKLLKDIPPDQLQALSEISVTEFFNFVKDNRTSDYISKSISEYVKNQVPYFEREQVLAEDITSVTLIRRKTCRKFAMMYTKDMDLFSKLMEEIDEFVCEDEAQLFNAFLSIQQEKINNANAKLAASEQELLEAQELADMGSFLWDLEGGTSNYTPGLMRIFELEETGRMDLFFENVHEEDRELVQAAIDKAMKGDGLYECEYRYIKNGKEKKIWSKGKVTFRDGKPAFMKGSVMDVTGKSRLLDELQRSEYLHKQAQALTHIGNWSWDVNSDHIEWSDEMYRIYGMEPQSEKISFDIFMSMVHPGDREKRLSEIQTSLKSGVASDYEMRIVAKDGTEKVLKGKGQVIRDHKNKVVKLAGTCQDISVEHKLNRELREKEEYLSQIITHAPDAVIVIDEQSIITLWNPKTEDIFGWKSEDVVGTSLTETIIPPQYREAHLAGMKRLLETGESRILNRSIEITALNKKGKEFYISITISPSMQQGKRMFIAFIRDITREKQNKLDLETKSRELEVANTSLEDKNVELERINKELESFNYIASHDLQEPLRKIQVFTNRILEKSDKQLPPFVVEYLQKIGNSSARMKNLIEDLLLFSQSFTNESNFEVTDLNQVLDEVKLNLSAIIEDRKVQIGSEKLPVLRVVPFQFQQVLSNLIMNSIKYSRHDVEPRIMIHSRMVQGALLNLPGLLAGTVYYEICVEDNGIGFDQAHAESIFRLFHRLHHRDEYSGTGIGLAICKKIIQNHKGFIFAKGEPGVGSTFCMYLPFESGLKKSMGN